MKITTTVKIENSFISDLRNYSKEVCVGCAAYCRDALTDVAKRAIGNFYSDYTPISYKRHYTNFLKNSFRKYYNNPHGKIIRGGVELTPDLVKDVYMGATGAEVFDFVYAGFHGVSSALRGQPPAMSPSPMDEINMAQLFISSDLENLKSYGIARANNGSYQVIEFM